MKVCKDSWSTSRKIYHYLPLLISKRNLRIFWGNTDYFNEWNLSLGLLLKLTTFFAEVSPLKSHSVIKSKSLESNQGKNDHLFSAVSLI